MNVKWSKYVLIRGQISLWVSISVEHHRYHFAKNATPYERFKKHLCILSESGISSLCGIIITEKHYLWVVLSQRTSYITHAIHPQMVTNRRARLVRKSFQITQEMFGYRSYFWASFYWRIKLFMNVIFHIRTFTY